MKKIISIMLAALMLISAFALTACDGCNEPADPEDTTDAGTNADGTPIETVEFETVDETVFTTDKVNLRSSTSTDADNKITSVPEGTELKRIGYHEEWSKVLYNGDACYIKTMYLTTEEEEVTTQAPPANTEDFTDVNETVYVYSDQDDDGKCDGRCDEEGQNPVTANLYPQPAKENMKCYLECGTELKRTGILIEDEEMGYGWSRVEYKGEVLYIRNSCVTTEKPHAAETADTTAADTTADDTTTAE